MKSAEEWAKDLHGELAAIDCSRNEYAAFQQAPGLICEKIRKAQADVLLEAMGIVNASSGSEALKHWDYAQFTDYVVHRLNKVLKGLGS